MTRLTIASPSDNSPIGEIETDTEATIDRKVEAALGAMQEWARVSPADRARRLIGIRQDTFGDLESLAQLLSREQGKTVKEARIELDRYLGAFDQYAGLATGVGGRRTALGPGLEGVVHRQPVGVVAGIVPWNFPASLFGTKLAPALAAGCAFLIKPAETTPLITRRLADIAAAHLPAGLVDVVVGGPEVGAYLVSHPGIAKIAFTGSTEAGRRIATGAAAGLKHVTLELGGSDPFVLCEDADIPSAVRCLMGTRFYNAGQVCVAPKRLIVHESIEDQVVERLAERIARIRPGPGLDPDSTMGPLHTLQARERFEEQVEDAASRGAKLVGGGRPEGADTSRGWFVNPSLLVDVPPEARARNEEVFGPALAVVPFTDDEEAVAVAKETPYSLGASVWSGDPDRALELASRIPAGYRWVNTLARVYDELPFGGVGNSGYGREHGTEALDYYLVDETYVIGHPVD